MSADENAAPKEFTPQPWQSLTTLVVFLVLMVVVYFIMHFYIPGSIDSKLSDGDKAVVSLILNDTSKIADAVRVHDALMYIVNSVRPADSVTAANFFNKYSSLKPSELLSAMPSIRISTWNYFWLNTDTKYLEVVFWAIFGVIASLLYFISEAMRNKNFKEEEMPVYLAKIYYAPLIALVIVFSYNLLTGNVNYDNSSLELLVISFILGFFSGRAIELLNKIKDVILPGKITAEEEAAGKIVIAGKVQLPAGAKEITPEKVKVTLVRADGKGKSVETETDREGNYIFKNIAAGAYKIKAETSSKEGKYSALIPEKQLAEGKRVDIDLLSLIKEKHEENPQ